MNDRITDLLDDASDDAGRPLGFTAADLAARGDRIRRRRALLGAGAVAAVVLVAAGGATAAAVHSADGDRPIAPFDAPTATDPAPTASPTTSPMTSPTEPSGGGEDLTRCDAAGGHGAPHLAADGWRLDASTADRVGATLTFVSGDGTRSATCTLWRNPTPVLVDTLTSSSKLDTTAIPQPWPNPDSGVESTLLCPKDASPGCRTTLYTATFPLHEGVVGVDVKTPDGRHFAASVGRSAYVVRFIEDDEDPADSVPPIIATLTDASGATIVRYDYNAALR